MDQRICSQPGEREEQGRCLLYANQPLPQHPHSHKHTFKYGIRGPTLLFFSVLTSSKKNHSSIYQKGKIRCHGFNKNHTPLQLSSVSLLQTVGTNSHDTDSHFLGTYLDKHLQRGWQCWYVHEQFYIITVSCSEYPMDALTFLWNAYIIIWIGNKNN